METEHTDIGTDELRRRVLYALLRPAVRLAAVAGVSMSELVELLQTAYFQEVRVGGATLESTAERLGVSRRTAARLSRQLKERFVAPDVAHDLPRRIEFMLAAEPMSAARVVQVLRGVERADVEQALAALREEGRVEERAGRTPTLHTVTPVRQLPRDTWIRRVGGLASFAENLADAAEGRFFGQVAATFARTLSFRMPVGAEAELEAFYNEHLLPRVVAMDDDEGGEAMRLSICWAPYDLARERQTDAGDEQ